MHATSRIKCFSSCTLSWLTVLAAGAMPLTGSRPDTQITAADAGAGNTGSRLVTR